MREGRFTVKVDAMTDAEVCDRHGGSTADLDKSKAKFGRVDVSDASGLKTFEAEKARLKKLLVDSMLDVSILKDLLGKCCQNPRNVLRRDR